MELGQLFDFEIAETKTFQKIKPSIDQKLYNKIKNYVYPQLRKNPFTGINIKKLKGNLSGYYRYRVGNYRLIYAIENKQVLVLISDLKQRKNAY